MSFAVANVVAFGTLGMLCYPYLAHGNKIIQWPSSFSPPLFLPSLLFLLPSTLSLFSFIPALIVPPRTVLCVCCACDCALCVPQTPATLSTGVLDSSVQIGTFLGLAIHDTSQVMGAALTYDSVYVDEVVLKTVFLYFSLTWA